MNKNILVVDDEKEIVELIELYLKNENCSIKKAFNGIQALKLVNEEKVDLAVVDLMMPELDGYRLINEMRKSLNIPIIIISAKSEGYDKVLGLNIGADDYITKPFDPLELVARVKAQIRRAESYNTAPEQEINDNIKSGDLTLNRSTMTVHKGNDEISLTLKEFKMLEMFMENKNRVLTKKRLFENVWEEEYLHDDNSIMVHISNLREKIENDSKNPKYITTIRGIGYRFEEKNEEEQ